MNRLTTPLLLSLFLSACIQTPPTPPPIQPPAPSTEFELHAISSMVKLHNSEAPYADLSGIELSSWANVSAAKNEREAFQLIISANQTELQNVQVAASYLSGPAGNLISSSNIELFYVHFIELTEASDELGGTGYYADALPPLNNEFEVEKGANAAIWVKLSVPENVVAGEYEGSLNVSTSNAGSASLPVHLRVWNFSLPEKPSMTAVFGISANALSFAYDLKGSELDEKLDEYLSFMLQNKVVPFSGIGHLYPSAEWNGEEVEVWFTDEQLSYMKKYINQYHASTWQFPIGKWMADAKFMQGTAPFSPEFNERMRQYIEKTIAIYKQEGIWNNGEYFTWIVDEPKTREAYEEVNDWSALVAGASPRPKFMVTEQITKQDAAWPALQNIDLWCTSMKVFVVDERADESRYEGEEWWWYNGGFGADYPNPELIDRQPAVGRVIPWYTYKLGIDGYLYWATTYWGSFANNPWNSPKLLQQVADMLGYPNGAGYMFYPSTLISNHTPMNNIEGVTTSIRWEVFIDGLEDYEYLTMASAGARIQALNLIIDSSNKLSFSKEPGDYEEARRILAENIEANMR